MISIAVSDERVKNLIKHNYAKNCVMVDDLFTLSLSSCKKSKLKYCLVCDELITSEQAKKIRDYYTLACESFLISVKTYERLAEKGNTCGIVVLTEIEMVSESAFSSFKTILVCDGLEISGNIGTIFRTAECAKIDCVVFTNLRAKVFDEKVVHSSRGMIFNVPFLLCEYEHLTALFKKYNITPVVCEPEQGIDYKEFDYIKRVAIIVGSERFGVDKRWFDEKCDYIKIAMGGEMDSLNVGVAASLVMYEAYYQKQKS